MKFKNSTVLWIFPLLLVLYETALYLSNDAYLPALPAISKEFSSSISLTQLTLTLWFLGSSGIQLFIGPLCDRFGRRPILLIGGLVFILSTIGCSIASNIETLLIARFIQGLSIPTMIIAGYSVIHELFDQKQAIKTLAFMNSITVLAPSLGPLAGGLLLYVMHWRGLFGILAVWAILTLCGLWKIMPETLSSEKKHPLEIKNTLKIYWSILSNIVFIMNNLIAGCAFGAMIAWICASSFLCIEKFHYTFIQYGIVQAVIFGGFIFGSRLVQSIIEKFSLTAILRLSMFLIFSSSLSMFLLSLIISNNLMTIIIPMIFLAVGAGLGYAILNRLAVEAS